MAGDARHGWRFGSRELSPEEIEALLRRNWWGTLATSAGGRPYAVPVVYGYDGSRFYVASSPGRKVRNLENNPAVCLTVAEVEADASGWSSVVVEGAAEWVRDSRGYLAALRALRRQRGVAGRIAPEDVTRLARARVIRIHPSRVSGRTKS